MKVGAGRTLGRVSQRFQGTHLYIQLGTLFLLPTDLGHSLQAFRVKSSLPQEDTRGQSWGGGGSRYDSAWVDRELWLFEEGTVEQEGTIEGWKEFWDGS